jgi:hypothetical protein
MINKELHKVLASNKDAIQKLNYKKKTTHWGQPCFMTQRVVSDFIEGDGLCFFWIIPMNHRPNFFVVQIDSRHFEYEIDDICDLFEVDVIDKIEELYPNLKYDWGVGFQYSVLSNNEIENALAKCEVVAQHSI